MWNYSNSEFRGRETAATKEVRIWLLLAAMPLYLMLSPNPIESGNYLGGTGSAVKSVAVPACKVGAFARRRHL